MSMKSQAKRSIAAANHHLAGARSTQVQRRRTCLVFIEWCCQNGTPLISIRQATLELVKGYLTYRGMPGYGQPFTAQFAADFHASFGRKPLRTASLHNLLGSLRRAMSALKGDPDGLGITAENLGLPSKSRLGTKLPVTDEVFLRAVEMAQALGEVGFAIMLKIERYFGHRGQEGLMSQKELHKYALEVAHLVRLAGSDLAASGGSVLPLLPVIDGTKTGNPRHTVSIAKYARESLQVIAEAMRYLQSHPFLVEGLSPGLKSARQKMQTLARKCGLVGQYSLHSLRYRYSVDKLVEMRDAGVTAVEAFALCARFLGHGPSRGRYIRMVYGRTITATFPRMRRRRDFKAAAREVEALIEQAFGEQGVEMLTPAQPLPPGSVPTQKRDQSSIKARRLPSRSDLR